MTRSRPAELAAHQPSLHVDVDQPSLHVDVGMVDGVDVADDPAGVDVADDPAGVDVADDPAGVDVADDPGLVEVRSPDVEIGREVRVEDDRGPEQVSPARQVLLDERSFLLRSLRDLDAEHAAGDLDPEDYEALRSSYTVQAAAVLRALAAGSGVGAHGDDDAGPLGNASGDNAGGTVDGPGGSEAGTAKTEEPSDDWIGPRRRRRRRLLVGGAVGCFVIAAVVLVVGELGIGLPGNPVTGSLTLTSTQQVERLLAQGEVALVEDKSAEALAAFEGVLRIQPTQTEALSEAGWLEYSAGVRGRDRSLVRAGQQDEDAAVAEAPSDFGPRLYLGSMLAQEGASNQSVAQFEAALSDKPPATTVAVFASTIDKVFGDAQVPVPSSVAAAVASSTGGSASSGTGSASS